MATRRKSTDPEPITITDEEFYAIYKVLWHSGADTRYKQMALEGAGAGSPEFWKIKGITAAALVAVARDGTDAKLRRAHDHDRGRAARALELFGSGIPLRSPVAFKKDYYEMDQVTIATADENNKNVALVSVVEVPEGHFKTRSFKAKVRPKVEVEWAKQEAHRLRLDYSAKEEPEDPPV